ncbi:precorrin-6A synthase (deacetylating) [Puniceibacterium sediminis]|uniref:Precorrin-6A synthase [deacetylating] n=1 Tax=Puniceibacterium sediminis TaxID=1608407 RepID=A0A238WB91_9RHOB|nr:precorrin-6A synthase (deacetylating) [Puniceibacterium sediminis]SNR43544.1 precorrin-6A synthase (deacetylating) [Puniceibacterium sediminis]
MIQDLWLIGIGTGSPAHVTCEGMQALREAAVILVPQKGTGKDDLAELRHRIITASGTTARVIGFDYPVRDPELPYLERVEAWHDEIARRWQAALDGAAQAGPVALLVWGDPSLYDSTIRIAARLDPRPAVRVVPGITAIQALTAAHAIPLNTVNGAVEITTGRRLRDHGWPAGAETVVVMLDGECSFQNLDPTGMTIWWGAFLGMPEQILHHGDLAGVSDRIIATRLAARAEHGWIMDIYLLRKA